MLFIMPELNSIIEPIKSHLARFEDLFAATLSSGEGPVQAIMEHLLDTQGKRLRPILVFLTASLFGEVNDQTYRVATFVEMLHTATLLHDDVVDDATFRRGKPSVNAQWDNLSAVLAGDYLLAKALLTLSNPDDSAILSEMLQTSLSMSEGELLQNQKRHTPPATPSNSLTFPATSSSFLSKEEYLSIITHKTAMLMRSCCVAGAMSVSVPLVSSVPSSPSSSSLPNLLPLIADFGLNLGLVFQMRDDLLDADDPAATAWAERLLPDYTSKTLAFLDALATSLDSSRLSSSLSPFPNPEIMASLRSLVLFCAHRSV